MESRELDDSFLGTRRQALRSLWALSDMSSDVNIGWIVDVIDNAPDPETAHQAIADHIQQNSEILFQKWRKVVREAWFDNHPHALMGLDIPLKSEDVKGVDALRDVHALLLTLLERPVEINKDDACTNDEDVVRLLHALPSLQSQQDKYIVSDRNRCLLRRMFAIMKELRLVRRHQGMLKVVKTRYDRFMNFPLPGQFYMIWHVDMYHVAWCDYVGKWGKHVDVIQHYIPLIWEVGSEIKGGEVDDMYDFVDMVVGIFYPLWQQEGVLDYQEQGAVKIFDIYERSSLPLVIESSLVENVFLRYGLICPAYSQESAVHASPGSEFQWTGIGATLLEVERTCNLPCGVDAMLRK